MGIGFSLFLFVVGAILTFAVDVNTSSGFSIDTVGIILMIGGLLGLVFSALFWSSFSPWSRRRTVAGGATGSWRSGASRVSASNQGRRGSRRLTVVRADQLRVVTLGSS